MQTIAIGRSGLRASRLAYGCMRIAEGDGKRAVHAAVDAGYTLFDHADIYGGGASEALFGDVLRESPGLREQILIVSKCGVRTEPARYDSSPAFVVQSVENSLRRLGIGCLDLLLLHRPDFLMRTDDVACAFEKLTASGMVAHFGVSNFSTSQLDLLQSALTVPLLVNQVEINIHNVDALNNGVLDQCQREQITPQAWCPLAGTAYEAWGNTFTDEVAARVQAEFARQSEIYGTDSSQVALAWLLQHPAGIAPIIGSTNPVRIMQATAALDIDYSREDWYRLLEARNGHRVA